MGDKIEINNTDDFQAALQKGEIENATLWLEHVVENRASNSPCDRDWNNWLRDRRQELVIFQRFKDDGTLGKYVFRSKAAAQEELFQKFGLRKTSDFQLALKQGDIILAEAWLNHIFNDKLGYIQYLAPWDKWLRNRQEELAEAKIKP